MDPITGLPVPAATTAAAAGPVVADEPFLTGVPFTDPMAICCCDCGWIGLGGLT